MKLTAILFLMFILTAAGTVSAAPSICSMVVGDKAWDMAETRQLTFREDGTVVEQCISPNGSYLAYVAQTAETAKLCLVKTTGGRPITLATGTGKGDDLLPGKPDGTELLWLIGSIEWSADSKCVAISVKKYVWEDGEPSCCDLILVYSIAGRCIASLPATAHTLQFKLSPQGKQLAAVISTAGADKMTTEPSDLSLVLHDTGRQTCRTLAEKDYIEEIKGFADAGRSLIYVVRGKSGMVLKKKPLDGGDDEILLSGYQLGISPDCRLAAVSNENGVSIWNLKTRADSKIVQSCSYRFVGWSSDSKFVVLTESAGVTDGNNARPTYLTRLWLAGAEKHSHNSLLIAHESNGTQPTWCANATKLAYTSRGQAYLVTIAERGPTPEEKLAAGLKLTEEEEKQVLLANGKHVGIAMQIYSADWDEALPGADSCEEDLKRYIRSGMFVRPGTDTRIFKYLIAGGTKLSSIEMQADTPIGELDAGYSWKVVIYADGHAKVVEK